MAKIAAEMVVDNQSKEIQVVPLDIAAAEVLSYDASAAQSSAIDSDSDHLAYVVPTTDCWITAGLSPTAVADAAGNMFIAKGAMVPIIIAAGDKIAVIKATGGSAGVLSIVPTKRV